MVEYIIKKWEIAEKENGAITMTSLFGYKSQTWKVITVTDQSIFCEPLTDLIIKIKKMAESQRKAFLFAQNVLNNLKHNGTDDVQRRLETVYFYFSSLGVKYYEGAQDILYFLGNHEIALPINKIIDSYEKRLTLLKDRINKSTTHTDQMLSLRDLIDWLADAPASFALRLKQFKIFINVQEQPGNFLENIYSPLKSSDEFTAFNIFWKGDCVYGC